MGDVADCGLTLVQFRVLFVGNLLREAQEQSVVNQYDRDDSDDGGQHPPRTFRQERHHRKGGEGRVLDQFEYASLSPGEMPCFCADHRSSGSGSGSFHATTDAGSDMLKFIKSKNSAVRCQCASCSGRSTPK